MPVPCRITLDNGTPGNAMSISTAPTVVTQGTNSASKPIRLKRIQLQSNQTGATQQVVLIAMVVYATGTSTGGSTTGAVPVDDALVGIYSPSTAFRSGTTTMGTTPTYKAMWSWNTANPFDITEGMVEIQDEFAVSKVWAFIIPVAPGVGFSLTGTVNFEEFG